MRQQEVNRIGAEVKELLHNAISFAGAGTVKQIDFSKRRERGEKEEGEKRRRKRVLRAMADPTKLPRAREAFFSCCFLNSKNKL